MRHSLYLAAAQDGQRVSIAYGLADHGGLWASDRFITAGPSRLDVNRAGHIALQRALRQAARHSGVVDLVLTFDGESMGEVGYELLGLDAPKHPALCRNTERILLRFNTVRFAAMNRGDDLLPEEAAVFDEALDALEQVRTLRGRLRLLLDTWTGNPKIIR